MDSVGALGIQPTLIEHLGFTYAGAEIVLRGNVY
jgi:hypothetical protein